jgi:hypothetical protein
MAYPHTSDTPGELYSLREWCAGYLSRWLPVERLQAPFGQEKIEALSHYQYCLCPENYSMPGYMTEKLPDALAAGCMPLYLGWGSRWPAPWDIGRLLGMGDVYGGVEGRCDAGARLAHAMRTELLWQTIRSTVGFVLSRGH